MDPQRFDTFARDLSHARSRRGVLASLLVGPLGSLGQIAAEGRKKKKKKKKKTSPPPGSPPAPGSPPSPSCPDGQRRCRGACLSVLICCDASDCAGGRTCQAGTCACPPDRPALCPGSTICQQCCVKADCTTDTRSGDGIPECSAEHACVCAQASHRYCPNRSRCGTCCDDAECTNGQICWNFQATFPIGCRCSFGLTTCTAVGRTGCIAATDPCTTACGTSCNPEDGDAACPCATDLVCDFDPAVQDGYYCRARSAG